MCIYTCFQFILNRYPKTCSLIGFIIAVLFLYLDTIDSRDRLRSLSGIFLLYGIGYIFSKHITKVSASASPYDIILYIYATEMMAKTVSKQKISYRFLEAFMQLF